MNMSGKTLRPTGLALLLVTILALDAAQAGAQTLFRFVGSAGQVGKALPPAGQPGGAPVNIRDGSPTTVRSISAAPR